MRARFIGPAFACIAAAALAAPAHATTVFCARDVAALYDAAAAAYWVNDAVEIRVGTGTHWLDRHLTFENYFAKRIHVKGGYSSFSTGQCNVHAQGAQHTVLRSSWASGFDVTLRSPTRVVVENISFKEVDEVADFFGEE